MTVPVHSCTNRSSPSSESPGVPYHLLFPLLSSALFVLGMMLAKQAITRGASPWTGTLLGNLWIAVIWGSVAVLRDRVAPMEAWGQAAIVGALFVSGQLFTYLAFQLGDVSVATPILGVKVLLVALLMSIFAHQEISGRIWTAGAMATFGIVIIQTGGRSSVASVVPIRPGLTVVLALLAATSMSLFDLCLMAWGPPWGSLNFLPVAFAFTGVFSLVFVPWADGPRRLLSINAASWIVPGTMLMALQALSMSFALATFGDAVRVNIVYALRGLWGVVITWGLARWLGGNEAHVGRRVMLIRLTGAAFLTFAVILAVTGQHRENPTTNRSSANSRAQNATE